MLGAAEALDGDFSLVLPTDCNSERLIEDEIKAVKMNAKIVNSFVACFSKSAALMRIIAYSQDQEVDDDDTYPCKSHTASTKEYTRIHVLTHGKHTHNDRKHTHILTKLYQHIDVLD